MHRTRPFSLCRGLQLLLALACGHAGSSAEPAPDTTDLGPVQRVVLGTGWRTFEPRQTDEHVTLVAGLQGAHHVWTSFLTYGIDSDVLRMSLSMGWEDEPDVRQLMEGNVAAKLIVDDEGLSARSTPGWPAVVPDPLCQDGRLLRMDLRVTAGELEASDSRRWVLDVPLEYRPPECGGPEPSADAGSH